MFKKSHKDLDRSNDLCVHLIHKYQRSISFRECSLDYLSKVRLDMAQANIVDNVT